MLKCVLFFSEKNIWMLTLSCSQQGYVMVVFTDGCFHLSYTHNYPGIYLHLQITAQMTCSRDQHQLPKISQPQSFGSYFFCAVCFPVWGSFTFFLTWPCFCLVLILENTCSFSHFLFENPSTYSSLENQTIFCSYPNSCSTKKTHCSCHITNPCGLHSPASSVVSCTNHI